MLCFLESQFWEKQRDQFNISIASHSKRVIFIGALFVLFQLPVRIWLCIFWVACFYFHSRRIQHKTLFHAKCLHFLTPSEKWSWRKFYFSSVECVWRKERSWETLGNCFLEMFFTVHGKPLIWFSGNIVIVTVVWYFTIQHLHNVTPCLLFFSLSLLFTSIQGC